jgi:hypothetical protein
MKASTIWNLKMSPVLSVTSVNIMPLEAKLTIKIVDIRYRKMTT